TDKYPPRIFNWQASILVPGGGLVEYNDEFPFEAPEDGYQPSAEFDMPTNALNWRPLVQKSYFIEFGSPPRYGRIQIQLNGASQKASTHRDGKRFIVKADDLLTAFLSLERDALAPKRR